jgi:hypothetical protein
VSKGSFKSSDLKMEFAKVNQVKMPTSLGFAFKGVIALVVMRVWLGNSNFFVFAEDMPHQ